jgi:Putative lumazine-binding
LNQSTTQQMPDDETAVRTVVKRLLGTIADRDPATMREILMADGGATQVRDGVVAQTRLGDLPDVIARGELFTGPSRLEERFYDPLIRIDENIALVWAHYDYLTDGAVHHWGTNILSLLKQDGVWRVSNIADNGRSGPRPPDWGGERERL